MTPTIYSFTGTGADGAYPDAELTLDSSGDLFGTTSSGGLDGYGTAFEIKVGTTTPIPLYSFTGIGTDGATPQSALSIDTNGDLFGTTSEGGSANDGTVFEIKAGTTTPITLYSFTGGSTDGNNPVGGVILDTYGNLFGTTVQGGADNDGTVFEIKAGATTATILYSFTGTGTDGANPQAGLTLDANGDLFGTTQGSGSDDNGTVFEIKAGTTTPITLYSFTGTGNDGAGPDAGVTLDANGDLFGTTFSGGTDGFGTVFEIKAGTTIATTLCSFTYNDGAYPVAAVTLDANGDLFGTTTEGGTDSDGTVFEIKAGTTTPITLYSFTGVGTDGSSPEAGVILGANGDLLGTTLNGGGTRGYGTIFELTVCFVSGTHIATCHGEVPVEQLAVGDMVQTRQADEMQTLPVKWIGWRKINLPTHPRPELVAPVRIRRGAFADNVPHRDLLLSPDHAIFVEGMLICAHQLINGTTIRQEMDRAEVEYFHIELDRHAILLTEGLTTESYVDTGNRKFFANSGQPLLLHPDLKDEADHPARVARSCAPFVSASETVRPVWEGLAARASRIAEPAAARQTTSDPGLHLVTSSGRTLKPITSSDGLYSFMLPAGLSKVRLASRAASPTDAEPWLGDRRLLGVNVERIVLRGDVLHDISVDHPGLTDGWWDIERNGIEQRRWTNGNAILHLPITSKPSILEIRACDNRLAYLVDPRQLKMAS
jgi:uncharacterized repeat protein (TIGR03803 family)